MADITKLRSFVDAYGVAVRAGVITPCPDDEAYVRKFFGLPEMSEDVIKDWAKSNNIRKPLTITQSQALEEEIKVDDGSNNQKQETVNEQ